MIQIENCNTNTLATLVACTIWEIGEQMSRECLKENLQAYVQTGSQVQQAAACINANKQWRQKAQLSQIDRATAACVSFG